MLHKIHNTYHTIHLINVSTYLPTYYMAHLNYHCIKGKPNSVIDTICKIISIYTKRDKCRVQFLLKQDKLITYENNLMYNV